jgi:hypothetical protein
MPKYLITWEYNVSAISNDTKERMAATIQGMEITKQWLKDKPKDEWGTFVGETGWLRNNGK